MKSKFASGKISSIVFRIFILAIMLLSLSMQSISAQASSSQFAPTHPIPLTPSGTILDTTPTYTWTKVIGATSYKIQSLRGLTRARYIYSAGSSACGLTTCSITPKDILIDGTYSWNVQALVLGVWTPMSASKFFTLIPQGLPFDSEFTSDHTAWQPVYGHWQLNSGSYVGIGPATTTIAGKVLSIARVTTDLDENFYAKFTFVANLKREGCDFCANRLIIRGSPMPLDSTADWNNELIFQYTNDGYISVWLISNGFPRPILGWTKSPAIHQTGWNVLKVAASDNHFIYYINGTPVWGGLVHAQDYGLVGIGAYMLKSSDMLSVDYAKLFNFVAPPPTDFPTSDSSINAGDPNMAPHK